MAATGTERRRASTVAGAAASATLLALATVLLAGCDRGGDPPDGSPSPTTESPPPAVSEVGGQADAEFPSVAQEYAGAAVAAWAAPDLIRLSELTTEAVHDQIVELPGPPDLAWSFIQCQEATSSSACSFHNTDGDYLVLEVDHDLLAGAEAVVGAEFETTTYPDDTQEYVEAFITAWQSGNPARMENLAMPEAAEVFRQLPPEAEVGYEVGKPGDRLTPVVVVLAEVEVEAQLSSALLGEPQAIREAVLPGQ